VPGLKRPVSSVVPICLHDVETDTFAFFAMNDRGDEVELQTTGCSQFHCTAVEKRSLEWEAVCSLDPKKSLSLKGILTPSPLLQSVGTAPAQCQTAINRSRV
jgi:hypothetical protein